VNILLRDTSVAAVFVGHITQQHPATHYVPPSSPLSANSIFSSYCYTKPYISLMSYFRNLNTDKPVQWQIGTKTINPTLIERQSGGRIYIDAKNHINLKKPQPTDSNIYR
jgi:hypothetical protein